MGSVCHWIYTTVSVLLAVRLSNAVEHRGRIFMVRSPDPIAAPIGDEVALECEMNIKPDGFRWRHFPINSPYSNTPISLDRVTAVDIPPSMYTISGKETTLSINVNSLEDAGDYQCLAIYGAAILSSVPGRVTIAYLGNNTKSRHQRKFISVGNNVAIRCDLPPSNPPAAVQYFKSNVPLNQSLVLPQTNTLLLQNVSISDSATYSCSANNYITRDTIDLDQGTFLTVTRDDTPAEPRFLSPPPSNYTVTAGDAVFMECSAVGNPPPKVTWYKLSGTINKDRFDVVPGGAKIRDVSLSDQGTYVCEHGNLKYHISLLIYEQPRVKNKQLPLGIKEGEDLDYECNVRGTPEPIVSWLINGHSVVNDNNIEVIGNKIYFRPVEKKHAGILQCLASNIKGADYGYTFLTIYPKQISGYGENVTSTKAEMKPVKTTRKPVRTNEMVPPSKPNVTRLSDESVMVRWSVPPNNGLPIQFFKVQYREFGQNGNHNRSKGSRWKTTNADIIPHLRSYQVDNLKPDHVYRFRIAAVYSNNDNKNGRNSAKFHLKREDFFKKNPLPVPKLTHTEATSPTSIKIYWEYAPSPNITVDGFFVNYQLTSSASDYFKATVDGEQTKSYLITHLQPDTSYDIKLQSYTLSGVSDFSAVLKQKTMRALIDPNAPPKVIPVPTKKEEATNSSQMNIIIGGVVGFVLLLFLVILACVMYNKKRAKDGDRSQDGSDRRDKVGGVTEERGHHIQVDGNGYVEKTIPRGLSNGCGPPPNRMNITANPLADADDNQNQNMIEMSCLSSQNNNCSTVEPSASSETPQPMKNTDCIKTRGKLKTEVAAGENYV